MYNSPLYNGQWTRAIVSLCAQDARGQDTADKGRGGGERESNGVVHIQHRYVNYYSNYPVIGSITNNRGRGEGEGGAERGGEGTREEERLGSGRGGGRNILELNSLAITHVFYSRSHYVCNI